MHLKRVRVCEMKSAEQIAACRLGFDWERYSSRLIEQLEPDNNFRSQGFGFWIQTCTGFSFRLQAGRNLAHVSSRIVTRL